jgi:putative flippase GtrA
MDVKFLEFIVCGGLLVASTAYLIMSLMALDMYGSIISAIVCGLLTSYLLNSNKL